MKAIHFFFIVFTLLSAPTEATTIVSVPLDSYIEKSNSISTIEITSAKCLIENCSSNAKTSAFFEYTISCKKRLYGNCLSKPSFQRYEQLCTGCKYIALSEQGQIILLLELREKSSRVIVNDFLLFKGNPVKYNCEFPVSSQQFCKYYKYTDFLKSVRAIKNVH